MIRSSIAVALIVVGALGLSSCASSAESPVGTEGNSASTDADDVSDSAAISVVASTNVWGDIAQQVGGDLVTVTSLIYDPSQDPHEFRPSGRDELAVSRADVVIVNGGGYDDVVGQMLASAGADTVVVTAVDAAAQVPSVDPDNEHLWFDVDAAAAVADAIADALSERDPAHSNEFRDNAASFASSLDPIRQGLDTIQQRDAGTAIAVTEPLPLYLTNAAGLEDVTPEAFSEAMEEGIDVAPADLAAVLDLLASNQVALLMYNEQSAGAQVDQVLAAARDNQVPVVSVAELLPEGENYQQWITNYVTELDSTLAAAATS